MSELALILNYSDNTACLGSGEFCPGLKSGAKFTFPSGGIKVFWILDSFMSFARNKSVEHSLESARTPGSACAEE